MDAPPLLRATNGKYDNLYSYFINVLTSQNITKSRNVNILKILTLSRQAMFKFSLSFCKLLELAPNTKFFFFFFGQYENIFLTLTFFQIRRTAFWYVGKILATVKTDNEKFLQSKFNIK